MKMASTSDNTSSGGCTTPNSNPNYDSDSKESTEDTVAPLPFQFCNACRLPFCDPRVLECIHTYCLFCTESMVVAKDDTKYVKCNACQYLTHLPTGNLDADLSHNYGVRRYIESLTLNQDDGLVCRSCKHGFAAVGRCFDCPMFLCAVCLPMHQTLTIYQGHEVSPLAETIQRPTEQLRCAAHGSQWATVYCHDCSQPFCEDCLLRHQTCRKTPIADSSFTNLMRGLAIEQDKAMAKVDHLTTGKARLEKNYQAAYEGLTQSYEECRRRLGIHYQDQLRRLNQMVNDAKALASDKCSSYARYMSQVGLVNNFIKTQADMALTFDNMKTKPFIDNAIQRITNTKPDDCQINFDVRFSRGSLELSSPVGFVFQPPIQPEPVVAATTPPEPIARPTNLGRSTGSHTSPVSSAYTQSNGYGSNTFSQSNSFSQSLYSSQSSFPTSELTNGYGQANNFGTIGSSPPNGHGSGTLNQAVATNGFHVNIGGGSSSNTATDFDHFQVPSPDFLRPSSSSPTTGSQKVGSSSYDYSSLNSSYQTWSNGVDQPGNNSGSQPVIDVFSTSNDPMFEAPVSRTSQVKTTSTVRRARMQYMAKFGEYGNMETQFTEPSGVAVDNQNRLIVADTNNHRVQIFDVFGNYICQFSSTVNGKLTYPNRIAVSKVTGKIIVTERAPSHRVQTYSPHGQHLDTFGEDILQHPRGVTLDKDDNIIIVECKVMRVTIFTITGKVVSKFGCSQHLAFPNSVAVNDSNEIFITDNRAHNVKVFTYGGDLLRTIGREGVTNYPIAVAINQKGHLVVADNHNNFNLTIFTQDGEFVAGYESKTKHAQCFDLALTDDGIAVLTSKDFKVYCYPYQDDCPYLPHYPRDQRDNQQRRYSHF